MIGMSSLLRKRGVLDGWLILRVVEIKNVKAWWSTYRVRTECECHVDGVNYGSGTRAVPVPE